MNETDAPERSREALKEDLELRLLHLELREKTRPQWLQRSTPERIVDEWGPLAAAETALMTPWMLIHILTQGWTDIVLPMAALWCTGGIVTGMWLQNVRAEREVKQFLEGGDQQGDAE